MIKPKVLSPEDDITVIRHVFSTPLVTKGKTWYPLVQLFAWPIMAWAAKNRRPERTWAQSLRIGLLTMPIVLAAEWIHNLAHAAAAKMVGKPVDAIRVTWGMPLLVYHDINDENVSPKEHIWRAFGGPLANLCLLPLAVFFRKRSHPESISRDAAEAAVIANTAIPAIGLLPIPGLDGGPILKWSLVENGQSREKADETVRKVNGAVGIGLTLGGILAIKRRRRLLGGLLLGLGTIAASIFLGILKEHE